MASSVSRQELIGWLQQQIAEQKKIDISTYSASVPSENIQPSLSSKDVSGSSNVQVLLPSDLKVASDAKKQRKHVKQLFMDRGARLSVSSY